MTQLAFTGDIAFTKYFSNSCYDKDLLSERIVDFLSSSDYTVVNMEGSIFDGTATADKPLTHANPSACLGMIKSINGNVWNLANNHAMDCGADDFEAEEDCFTIYTDPDEFNAVADAMGTKNYTFASAQIEMVPQNYQKLDNEEHSKLMEKLIDIMEEDDDVQNVWHNWEE